MQIDIVCRAPDQIDRSDAASFKELVLAAGEVNPDTLPGLYDSALVLAFARSGGQLIGVGAIKRPYPDHRDTVFKKARSALSAAPYRYEVGWFHVLKDFEGKGATSRMVEKLMPWADGASVYATSRIDNAAMHGALIRRGGFTAEGSDYPPTQGKTRLRLFVRPY